MKWGSLLTGRYTLSPLVFYLTALLMSHSHDCNIGLAACSLGYVCYSFVWYCAGLS